MLKLIVTDAGVSKGFKDYPALRFSEGEGTPSVRFRIGKRVYDNRCENGFRWINLNVKAFGEVCERIRKMKLKEGSFVNISGHYDEESWAGRSTGEQRTSPVLIVDEIEYCFNGNGGKGEKPAGEGAGLPAGSTGRKPEDPGKHAEEHQEPESTALPENFTGFEGFGGNGNPFF